MLLPWLSFGGFTSVYGCCASNGVLSQLDRVERAVHLHQPCMYWVPALLKPKPYLLNTMLSIQLLQSSLWPADGPYQQQQQQHRAQQQPAYTLRSPPDFPQPPGPICRVEPCLLAFNLPKDVSKHSVQAALSAEEVWIMEQQHGSSGCASACCTFKSVL